MTTIPLTAIRSVPRLTMILVALVVLGQLADLLTFAVPGSEVGALGGVLHNLGPGAVYLLKLIALSALAFGAYALRHRPKFLALLASVGFFGAFTNFASFVTA
jgi:hydrogenase/urease accessory protein HupE